LAWGIALILPDREGARQPSKRMSSTPPESSHSSIGGVMKRLLVCLAMAALPGVAVAQPPATGTTHTFVDPIYKGTVFCDTFEQVREIATAQKPEAVYREYMFAKNDRNEPVCLAIVPTAIVNEVTRLGTMQRDGKHFVAWAVQATVGGMTAFGLYLEEIAIA
jgi:hypothetical protein